MELAKSAWAVQGKSAGYKRPTSPVVAVTGSDRRAAEDCGEPENQIEQRAIAVKR